MFDDDGNVTIIDAIRDMLPIAIKILDLKTLPKFKMVTLAEQDEQPSFGRYSPSDKTLYVNVLDRHPVDILRTIAHELVHAKQDELEVLHDMSGETGSDEENEANAKAGVIMRMFNKKHPKYLKLKPIIKEGGEQSLLEKVVGKIQVGDFKIDVDDHSFNQTSRRRVSPHLIDYVIRLLPTVKDKIDAIEIGQQFWVYCDEVTTALGFRKMTDGLLFKTVVPDSPYDGGLPVITVKK